MTDSVVEKRRASRLPVNLDYRLTINEEVYTGCIGNISLSGAYLATSEPSFPPSIVLQQGLLDIKFEEEWCSLNCEVVYIGRADDEFFPVGTGVAFSDDELTTTMIWNITVKYLTNL